MCASLALLAALALCAASAQAGRQPLLANHATNTCPLQPGYSSDMDACKLTREVEPSCQPMLVHATAETSEFYGGAYPGALGPAGCACDAMYPGHKAGCVACKVCQVVQTFADFCDAGKMRKPSPDWAYTCAVAYPGDEKLMVNCGSAGPFVQRLEGGSLPRPVPKKVRDAIANITC